MNDLSCQGKIEMSNEKDTRTICDSSGKLIGQKGGGNDESASFKEFDLKASNGVVHVINNLLLLYNPLFEEDKSISFQKRQAPILRLANKKDP